MFVDDLLASLDQRVRPSSHGALSLKGLSMTSLGTTGFPAIPDSHIARDATERIRSVESDLLYYPCRT